MTIEGGSHFNVAEEMRKRARNLARVGDPSARADEGAIVEAIELTDLANYEIREEIEENGFTFGGKKL